MVVRSRALAGVLGLGIVLTGCGSTVQTSTSLSQSSQGLSRPQGRASTDLTSGKATGSDTPGTAVETESGTGLSSGVLVGSGGTRGTGGSTARSGLAGLGTAVRPAVTFSSALSSANHSVPGSHRALVYDNGCTCFAYAGPAHSFS